MDQSFWVSGGHCQNSRVAAANISLCKKHVYDDKAHIGHCRHRFATTTFVISKLPLIFAMTKSKAVVAYLLCVVTNAHFAVTSRYFAATNICNCNSRTMAATFSDSLLLSQPIFGGSKETKRKLKTYRYKLRRWSAADKGDENDRLVAALILVHSVDFNAFQGKTL